MSLVRRTSSSSSAIKRLKPLAVAHQRLACGGVRPHGRIGQLRFNFGEFPADAGRVKDTPAGRELGRARERKRIRDRVNAMLCS